MHFSLLCDIVYHRKQYKSSLINHKNKKEYNIMRDVALKVPEWLRKNSVYQINPRTFSKEGTINAIKDELPFLKELGFNIIYLCPIFEEDDDPNPDYLSPRQKKSKTGNPKNPYRINDYFFIDEEYGTMEDLKELVNEAHKRDMKVLLDLVYMHIGPNAPIIKRYPEFAKQDRDGNIVYTEYNFPTLDFRSEGLREYLSSFDNAEYKTLEELCDIVDYRGKTPRKVDDGIFLVTAKNIRKGFIDYDKSKEYISPEDYDEVMHRGFPKIGDVLITTEAPCGNVAQIDNENIALAQRVIKYRPKNNNLNSTFLKYVLLGKEFQDKLERAATGGTVKGIKGSKLHQLTIPVPSIEEQERIVAILERFDTLCNDISEGLPAEIEARQKQYEYYRDKLLTFKALST